MAHLIGEKDNMLSIGVKPWHGLGIVLDDYVETKEAQKLAGLGWCVTKEPIFNRGGQEIPEYYGVTRSDTGDTLGIVKGQYEPYQNDEMFEFMDNVMQAAGTKIETCGSLRNGRTVWALAKAGTKEYLSGDPVEEFFLFKNGFDGFTNIELCFTDVRVVCNNTLTMALKGASNLWKIRHTQNHKDRMQEVSLALAAQAKNSAALKDAMIHLLNKAMTDAQIHDYFVNLATPPANRGKGLELKTIQKNVIETMDGIYFGEALGMSLPGVRGTAYGALQTATAFADHFRTVRAGSRDKIEARFESNFMGSSAEFKADAFNLLMAA